jgi:2-polyprenyl-3-methyl-5-hydroxy-6-metoxy-1,4-benzoquinol methylase
MTTDHCTAGLEEFIEEQRHVTLEDKKPEFEAILRLIKQVKSLQCKTEILEIGTGIGWLLILCEQLGMKCKGVEVSPELVRFAQELGRKYGVTPNIQTGQIEDIEIGTTQYDVVIATSTFEHVKNWETGLKKIFNALKPGGVLYFYSTNKFSFKQGEYDFPFYGWFPDAWRYRFRIARQGENIMKWGIDFNQFTHFQLRRFFRDLGFSKVLDRVDVLDPDNLNHPTLMKKLILKMLKRVKPLKHLVLLFSGGTLFLCVK